MTPEQILEKAVKRAIAGGFDYNDIDLEMKNTSSVSIVAGTVYLYEGKPLHSKAINSYSLFELIYNHDFARALWGEDGIHQLGQMSKWKWYLANMVLADDPIVYLGENLPA